jgi:hypothetical protein
MPIPTIPQFIEAKFGDGLRSSAKEILTLCAEKLGSTQSPAQFFAHVAMPLDYDAQRNLCLYLTHIHPDPTTAQPLAGVSEEDVRPSDLVDKILLCAIPIAAHSREDIRIGTQGEIAEPATEDRVSAECIAQAQSAWLCLQIGAAWTPTLRLENIESSWIAKWTMH